MQITNATFPPHVARAYNVPQAPTAARAVRSEPTLGADTIAKIAPASPKATGAVNRLVAQVVPGSISFNESGEAVPKAPSIPIYTNGADRNAAATRIAIGSSLDITG